MTLDRTTTFARTIALTLLAMLAFALPTVQATGDHGDGGDHPCDGQDGDGQHGDDDGGDGKDKDGKDKDAKDKDGKDKDGKDNGDGKNDDGQHGDNDDGQCGEGCGQSGGCPPKLECPTKLKAVANGDKSVTLTFKLGKGAEGSNVYRQDGGKGEFRLIKPLDDEQSYTDKTTKEGKSYAYMVTSVRGGDEAKPCPIVEVTAIPEFPTVVGMGLATSGGLLAMALFGRRRKP